MRYFVFVMSRINLVAVICLESVSLIKYFVFVMFRINLVAVIQCGLL